MMGFCMTLSNCIGRRMMNRLFTYFRSFLRNARGAALIEFTIMMPILFSLAFGVTEFGRFLQHHHVVQKSMRDAARYLGRIETDCPATGADWSAAIVDAKNLAMRGSLSGTDPLILSYWNDPNSISVDLTCFDNSAGAFRGTSTIPLVRVSAEVPYTDLGMLAFFGIGSVKINLSHEEMNFGE